jgi:hypothetical protein
MENLVLFVGLPLLIVLFLHLRAAGRFEQRVHDAMRHVRLSHGGGSNGTVDIDALPPLIRAFAEKAGVPCEATAVSAFFEQLCEMRMNPGEEWMKLHAKEVMGAERPAFVWFATQKRAWLTTMRVVDAYVGGAGMLSVRLFGSIPLADIHGEATDQAELQRYLAELPWAPDAIFRNADLRWQQTGADLVEVEAGGGETLARVRFRFDAEGDIVEMQAEERGRSEGHVVVKRPWRGYFTGYKVIEGAFAGATGFRRIPTQGEVGWILDGGYFAYWRGQIATYGLEYEKP